MVKRRVRQLEARRKARWREGLRHRAPIFASVVALGLLAAACSSSGSASSSAAAAGPPPPTVSGGPKVVKVTTVPTYGRILTDSNGDPLYTLSGTCTGACATAWPALIVGGVATPTGGAGVTGTLGTTKLASGLSQLTYNGSPLYTYTSDSSGQVTGDGVAGFSVVKVSASTTATGSTTSTTTASGY